MDPFVSIIIPCRNEGISIRRCLESILASDYPPDRMEILVADGLSTDGTRARLGELAVEDTRIRMLNNHARITPHGLNLAIREARGELILRVDAHSTIAPDYLPQLVGFLEANPKAWGAGGRMVTKPETSGPFSVAIPVVLSHRFGVGNSQFRTSAGSHVARPADTVFNCCWRRDVFQTVGLFREELARSQDIELSTRISAAGGTLWWVPAACTTYFARTGFGSFIRHNWSNGLWSVLPTLYTGRTPVRWRHLVPLAFVSSVLMTFAIMPFFPWAPMLALGPYVAVNFGASASSAWQRRDGRLLLLLPPAFAGLHFGYGAGSLWGALRVLAHRISAMLTETTQSPTTTL